MCTAATYKTKDFYFGRTLDYEFSYGDEVTITPRNFEFSFRYMGCMKSHYAILGMAHIADGFPLYYDAINEKQPENLFSDKLNLQQYSRGMGAMGLPGDLSSSSRFVRVAFTKLHGVSDDSEEESVNQFFHILGSVEQQRGCCEVADGEYEITLYTSCCNANRGIYYYTTYGNHQINAVDMHHEDLDGTKLVHYPLLQKEQIRWQN